MLVSSHLIFIYTEVRSTPGALVAIPNLTPSVTDNASGLSPAAVPSISTSLKVGTTSYATTRCARPHPSAMELTNTSGSGLIKTIEDSGLSGVLPPFGLASATGGSPSTSESICGLQ